MKEEKIQQFISFIQGSYTKEKGLDTTIINSDILFDRYATCAYDIALLLLDILDFPKEGEFIKKSMEEFSYEERNYMVQNGE